jgi:hypothetical protein
MKINIYSKDNVLYAYEIYHVQKEDGTVNTYNHVYCSAHNLFILLLKIEFKRLISLFRGGK